MCSNWVPAALLSTASLYLWWWRRRRQRRQQQRRRRQQRIIQSETQSPGTMKAEEVIVMEEFGEVSSSAREFNITKELDEVNITRANATMDQETSSSVKEVNIAKTNATMDKEEASSKDLDELNITKAEATAEQETGYSVNEATNIMKEVDDIISEIVGLDGLKLQLRKWIRGLVMYRKRTSLGLKVGTRKALHMAFLGNPGTGKTMVARHLGKILHKLGLTSTDNVTEVQRTKLVAKYVGQTGPKTREIIKKARGGILFVDEAYRLVPEDSKPDFGVEALEEIMAAMDSGDIVTIFAGYKKEMERVISANPGFSRRVSKILYFDDHHPTDIATILHSKMESQEEDSFVYGFKLHPDCSLDAIASLIREHTTEEVLKKMNGGLVDPWLVNALESMDLRLDDECTDADTLTTITMKDLGEGLEFLSDCLKTESNHEKGPIPSMYI